MNQTVTERSRQRTLLVRVGLSLGFLASVCGSILALLLLVVATRLNSKLFALAVLIALSVAAWWAVSERFCWRRPRFRLVRPAIVLVVGLFALAGWKAPTGRVSPETSLIHVGSLPRRAQNCSKQQRHSLSRGNKRHQNTHRKESCSSTVGCHR